MTKAPGGGYARLHSDRRRHAGLASRSSVMATIRSPKTSSVQQSVSIFNARYTMITVRFGRICDAAGRACRWRRTERSFVGQPVAKGGIPIAPFRQFFLPGSFVVAQQRRPSSIERPSRCLKKPTVVSRRWMAFALPPTNALASVASLTRARPSVLLGSEA